jgi:hypothetical protein
MAYPYQALLGDLAAMIGVQVVQFPARARHAADLDHAAIEERLVARVVIADALSYPVSQELAGMRAAAPVGKVVDDRFIASTSGCRRTPQVLPTGPRSSAGAQVSRVRICSPADRAADGLGTSR